LRATGSANPSTQSPTGIVGTPAADKLINYDGLKPCLLSLKDSLADILSRHLAGECTCEVIFEEEDREKGLRSRPRKGAHKGKGKEVIQGEHGGYGMGEGGAGGHGMGSEGDAGGYARHMVEGDPGSYGEHALAVVEPHGFS